MNELEQQAKNALDALINKSRVHLYKPIQIAEILYANRLDPSINLLDVETYRTKSKQWRDKVSQRLVGRVSTSSAKFQDDVFSEKAIPPALIAVLARINTSSAKVESYIYHKLAHRLNDVSEAFNYLYSTTVPSFSLTTFLDYFEYRAGLRRSVDKAYEIVVASLFNVLVQHLQINVTLKVHNPDPAILHDFATFMSDVVGLDHDLTLQFPARIFRAGVANAADRGLDMWANFGTAVQVKHIRLTEEVAENISMSLQADAIVIVCKSAEAKIIHSVVNQLNLRIRSIITEHDLIHWYDLVQTTYQYPMGTQLLTELKEQFIVEFPLLHEIEPFLQERNYTQAELIGMWAID